MKLKTHFCASEHFGNKFYSIFRMNLNIHLMLFACLFIPFQLVFYSFTPRTIRFLVHLLLLLAAAAAAAATAVVCKCRLFGLWPLCVRQLLSVINLWVDLWPAYQIHASATMTMAINDCCGCLFFRRMHVNAKHFPFAIKTRVYVRVFFFWKLKVAIILSWQRISCNLYSCTQSVVVCDWPLQRPIFFFFF